MKDLEGLRRMLEKEKPTLKEQYGVGRIGIFGSYARGEEGESSDIDVLVEFERPIGLVRFMRLEEHISNLLGAKVDLVSKKALKPNIGRRILEQVVYV